MVSNTFMCCGCCHLYDCFTSHCQQKAGYGKCCLTSGIPSASSRKFRPRKSTAARMLKMRLFLPGLNLIEDGDSKFGRLLLRVDPPQPGCWLSELLFDSSLAILGGLR